MQIVTNYKKFPQEAHGSVLLIGNFDGVHLGHVELIKKAHTLAKKNNLKLTVLTFDPHPAAVLSDKKFSGILTLDEKIKKLEDCDVDFLLIQKFTKIFAKTPPSTFIKDIVVRYLKPRYIMLGENSRFGANKSGDLKLLHALSKKLGFIVKIVTLKKNKGVISSSKIRTLLQTKDIAAASKLLGYEIKI